MSDEKLIKCKDCISWDTSWSPHSVEDGMYYCWENDTFFGPDEFCSRAERKDDQNEHMEKP